MYSYTGLRVGLFCARLFNHYKETHEAFLDTSVLRWGRSAHERFEDRIAAGAAKNIFEKSILVIATDWIYEFEARRGEFHGVLDLYSPSKNVAIEYKLNSYDPVQLDFYAWLIDGEIYLYRDGKELVKHEYDIGRLERFIDEALRNISDGGVRVSTMCARCVIAHTCPVLEKMVSDGDVDARLLLAENFKQRARLLEDIPLSEEGQIDGRFYRVTAQPQNIYKLKREVAREEVVRKLIERGRLDLLEFTPANIREVVPEAVVEIQQIRKRIERKEESA